MALTRPDGTARTDRRRRALLRSYLSAVEEGVDWSTERYQRLEKAFLRIAAPYGEEHGISHEAWRQFGVAPEVLAAAGIVPLPRQAPPRPHIASRS